MAKKLLRGRFDVAFSQKRAVTATSRPGRRTGASRWPTLGCTDKKNATAPDVRAMLIEVAKGIYRAKYWDAQRCDELPAGVDYGVFDHLANSGTGRSGKVLRRKLGLPDATSTVTIDVVVAALRAAPETLAAKICDERLAFLKSLKTWPVSGKAGAVVGRVRVP